MEYDNNFLQGKFQSLVKLSIQLDKSPKRFGTDGLLSHSEIHLVEIIGDNEGVGVTDLAHLLGITKGAVSQSLKKLDTKGYVEKRVDPDNLSRIIVLLTSKGKAAYWGHKQWHEEMDGGFSQYLEELEEDELKTICVFLERLEDFLSRRVKFTS